MRAAIWVEQLARTAPMTEAYPFPFVDGKLDFRPLLLAMALDRAQGRDVQEIARSFLRGVAQGLSDALNVICGCHDLNTVVLSRRSLPERTAA